MLLTESKAMTKWCPIAKGDGPDLCLASECAMWRWWATGNIIKVGIEAVRTEGGRVEERVKYAPEQPTQGYCGLAGRPEVAV